MDLIQVKKLQRAYGVANLQKQIEDGDIWKFEGSVGRFAMDMLDNGVCFLGKKATFDYYGNKIPNRKELKEGSKGTRNNSIRFWSEIEDGNFDYIEFLEENFK